MSLGKDILKNKQVRIRINSEIQSFMKNSDLCVSGWGGGFFICKSLGFRFPFLFTFKKKKKTFMFSFVYIIFFRGCDGMTFPTSYKLILSRTSSASKLKCIPCGSGSMEMLILDPPQVDLVT